MSVSVLKKASGVCSDLGATAKGLVKLLLQSHRCRFGRDDRSGDRLVVMGNGPSLADTMRTYPDILEHNTLMAVNFAANAEEFYRFRPRYYVLADPIFFSGGNDKVDLLMHNFTERVDWPMTLFVPMDMAGRIKVANPCIDVRGFNFIGVGGFSVFRHAVYRAGRAMPRPRNVLIPAIMIGIRLGYKEIYITGADHSWTRTLDVDDMNRVVTVQPHFYKDDEAESRRVASVYRDIHMHDILLSFHIAFRAYFDIEEFARQEGVRVINATPGSFIDAFERGSIASLSR
ncbi:MAG: hypothetical protein NC043_00260 [Muribaculaceae bacterium]|nr:hypothetical protein [Muribaculaceae bacterium]